MSIPRATAKEPAVSFATPRAWSEWLEAHHASSRGVWLKLAKKGSNATSLTYPAALEVALAWGWIDGPNPTRRQSPTASRCSRRWRFGRRIEALAEGCWPSVIKATRTRGLRIGTALLIDTLEDYPGLALNASGIMISG